jgi:hypothetical protein
MLSAVAAAVPNAIATAVAAIAAVMLLLKPPLC